MYAEIPVGFCCSHKQRTQKALSQADALAAVSLALDWQGTEGILTSCPFVFLTA